MKTRLEVMHFTQAHNESKQGLNLRTSRSKQSRISETPLFSQPSKQKDLFKNHPDQK
jgi:hypothetical protein